MADQPSRLSLVEQLTELAFTPWISGVVRNALRRKLDRTQCGEVLFNLQDWEDVIADAFVKALAAIDTFEPDKGSLKTWFCRIAINEAINMLRARARLRISEVSTVSTPDPGKTPSIQDERKATKFRRLREALEKLPKLQRAIKIADMQAAEKVVASSELAAQLGLVDPKRIPVERKRGTDTLRREMKKHGYEVPE